MYDTCACVRVWLACVVAPSKTVSICAPEVPSQVPTAESTVFFPVSSPLHGWHDDDINHERGIVQISPASFGCSCSLGTSRFHAVVVQLFPHPRLASSQGCKSRWCDVPVESHVFMIHANPRGRSSHANILGHCSVTNLRHTDVCVKRPKSRMTYSHVKNKNRTRCTKNVAEMFHFLTINKNRLVAASGASSHSLYSVLEQKKCTSMPCRVREYIAFF